MPYMSITRQNNYRYLTVLVAFGFILQALVPYGFMPVYSQDGKTEIIICTGYGPVKKIVDLGELASSRHNEDTPSDEHAPCPYAPVIADNVNEIQSIALPVYLQNNIQVSELSSSLAYSVDAKTWIARAPPLS